MQTRRELMRGAASVAALGGVVGVAPAALAAGGDDPMFAAILAHWKAYERSALALIEADGDESPELEATRNAEWDAAWGLFDVEATTVGGVFALLRYIDAFKRGGFRDWPQRAPRETMEGDDDYRSAVMQGSVDFEDDAIRFVVNALARLTGNEPVDADYREAINAALTREL